MRRLLLMSVLLMLPLLWGCGGGKTTVTAAQPNTATANRLDINYLYLLMNLPESNATEDYSATVRLWRRANEPRLFNLSLSMPYSPQPLPLGSPGFLSPTDGTNTSGVPYLVYWGNHETIPAGQPLRMATGAYLPGYIKPADDLFIYGANFDLTADSAVAGQYSITDGADYGYGWAVPDDYAMMGGTVITKPDLIIINSAQPITVVWNAVPHAVGYFVYIEGDVEDQQKELIGRILWTSAAQAADYDAIYDLTPDLLPSTTLTVTAPAQIFHDCTLIRVYVVAQGPTFVNDATQPALHILSSSVTMSIFTLFNR